LAERRLAWLDRRQSVLAANIANADNARFRPRDLTPFRAQLGAVLRPALRRSHPRTWHAWRAHRCAPGPPRGRDGCPTATPSRSTGRQCGSRRTDTAHALAMAVHRSFTGMFRLTLGR
jgi:flagellar basal-body rod protein FlgB